MSDSDQQKPAGYGRDQKGAAGGAVKNEGRAHVAHKAPMSGVADAPGNPTAQTFTIDGREVDIRAGETIFRAARRLGIKLPHLCYLPKPGYRPDGNCRVCMVEIEGERVLTASCIRTPSPGMKVRTETDRAKTARKMVAISLNRPTSRKSLRQRRRSLPAFGAASRGVGECLSAQRAARI